MPTPAARDAEISALLARVGPDEEDADLVRAALREEPELLHGARGIAVFASSERGVLEVVPLPDSVEPLAVVDSVPWLEPLAALLTSERWGVAVVSRRAARLFRGGPLGLVEFAHVEHDVHRRHAQGGWSQARYQRGIDEQVAGHVRAAVDLLERAHRRRAFERLAVVASDELLPLIEARLSDDLRDRLAGTVARDLEHASVEVIARALTPTFERAARERERHLLDRLEESLSKGGHAAAGLDEVLSTLEQRRVEVLLVAEGAQLEARRCPACGGLFAGGDRCRIDRASLSAVDAVAHAIDAAVEQGAEVVVVHHDHAAELVRRGSLAALLRWS